MLTNGQNLSLPCTRCTTEKDRQRYSALFEKNLCPFAVYEVIRDDRGDRKTVVFRDVNPAYEAVMGIRREDVIGKSFREVWPLTEQVWLDIIEEVVKTGEAVDHQGFSADIGKHLQALAFAITPQEVAVLFLDITQRVLAQQALKRKEERLFRYRETLRKLATQLTLAEEKTRRQIATDLHDRIGYSLAMTLHKLHQAEENQLSPGARKTLQEALAMVEGVIRDTRSLTFEISSPLLYEVGLEAALESLGEQMLSPHDISFYFEERGPFLNPDMNIKVLLFQMTRELLVNVIKHAQASKVELRVTRESDALSIEVEDNGVGFSTPIFRESHQEGVFGLFSIRERLRHVGGIIQVGKAETNGARVTLWAPSREHPSGDRS